MFQKLMARSLYGGPGGLMVGPGGLTWQPLLLHFGLVSSGVYFVAVKFRSFLTFQSSFSCFLK
jgi:hypothetical protein